MKKMITLVMMMAMTITTNAMSYTQARNEALYLSDKMAYELNLTNDQFEDVYEINLDYLMSVYERNDAFGKWWDRRNTDLQYVLTAYQYNKYLGISYFYRPLGWDGRNWTFNIYSHYTNRSHFYKARPTGFASYRGGNNRKPANHYADRNPTGNNHGNGSTWRNTGNNNRNNGHNGNNRDVAHRSHSNGSFSGRR